LAAFVGLLLVVGARLYFEWQRARLDNDVAIEFLDIYRQAHTVNAEALDLYVDRRAHDRKDLVIWDAQRTSYGKDLGRSGNVERVSLPKTIGSDWIETAGARAPLPDRPQEFRTRGHAALIKASAGSPPIVIFVGRDMRDEAASTKTILFAGGVAVMAVAFFVLVSASLTARFIVSRIGNISRTAEEIIRGDLARRISVSPRSDEFDELSATLNTMLDRIQKLLTGMKEVSDNIAHDLRTPLYRLRSRIELALIDVDKENARRGPREALELGLKEADRLLATFNALLSIARLEAGAMRDNLIDVELQDVVRDVAELYAPVAEDRHVQLVTAVESGLKIVANRALIVQALSNLVDNALKYSPDGGRVVMSAARFASGRSRRPAIDLVVADQGPGIAAEDRARVIERFVRLDRGRGAPGNGLGLSLVSAIASLHDAALILEDGDGGLGLTVRLRFDAA
jgi:signal transduction histidine kinase